MPEQSDPSRLPVWTAKPDSGDGLRVGDLVMAWAQDCENGVLRYILELGEHERGRKCNCVCISCQHPLMAVNAAKDEYQKRPHFRHADGVQKDSCMVIAARAAIMEVLTQGDTLLLPRRRRGRRVEGLSGQFHEAWVEAPPERIRVTSVDFQDKLKAVLRLDDGRQLVVHLVGSAHTGEHGNVVPAIDIIVDDASIAAIAAMSPDEIRRRLVPLLEGACWRRHWEDDRLDGDAEAAARAHAADSLDWDDADDLPEDTPADLRRESLLHRVVKAILEKHKHLRLPSFPVRVERQVEDGAIGSEIVIPEYRARLQTVTLERRLGRIVPDVVAQQADGKDLLIEVTVTNRITDERIERIGECGLPAVEIDVGRMGGRVTRAELERLVIDEVAGKRWLYHPRADEIRYQLLQEVDAEIEEKETNLERQRLASFQDAEYWADEYLNAIEQHAQAQARVIAGGEDDGLWDYYRDEATEAAMALSGHGYPEAEEPEFFLAPSSIVVRILSIKTDTGVGYRVDTGWEVINAILQDGRANWRWHTLYLMAIRVYKPKLNKEQAVRVDRWRGDAWESIEAEENFYVRDTKFDRLLGLLFPEMRDLLARPLVRQPHTGRQAYWPPSLGVATLSGQPEESLWLRGRKLDEWKRRNPEAAKNWFKKKK
jgi:hypothetical protein